jgi:hypothetical protein
MSRTEPANYLQVVCECPHGHLLGAIVQTRSGLWWGDRQLPRIRKGQSGAPVSTTRLPVGEKIRADCAACRKAGRYGAHYQASWKAVAAKLAEARDTRSDRVTLVMG